MSNNSNEYHQTSILRRPMPLWLAATIVGAFLGGSGTYQVMRAVGYNLPDLNNTNSNETGGQFAEMRAKMEEMMRVNMEQMMRGSMMGRGSASEQRILTALVGKLDLLSNGVHIELEPEQVKKLASTLAQLDQAEKMTSDEAQGHIDAIQKLLNEEQKASLAAIDLPSGGPSDNRGMGGTGPPLGTMGSGMMNPPSDDNPFQQEINLTRLQSFLDRLRQSSVESPDVTEELQITGTPQTTNATNLPSKVLVPQN
jgi:hypothetical protein